MDLIYMNESKEDVGVMRDYTFDLAFGSDENNFECKIVRNTHCCKAGFFLYYEGTEYGGIIDRIGVDTGNDEITYIGRTWHGIMETKVLKPDDGEDYLIVTGEANSVLSSLITRMGLSDLFSASTEDSGINISNYKVDRYIKGYSGIKKMLKAAGAKLHISFEDGFAVLSAKLIVDYSKDEQFDDDQISFNIEKNHHPVNHVVCLGKGDLAEREVIHVYAGRLGNICDTQVLTGIEEVEDVYDYPNAESSEELRQGGIKMIEESWGSNTVEMDFNAEQQVYDVGDIIGATETVTGTSVTSEIVKKIVKYADETLSISYSCGENTSESTIAIVGSAILDYSTLT